MGTALQPHPLLDFQGDVEGAPFDAAANNGQVRIESRVRVLRNADAGLGDLALNVGLQVLKSEGAPLSAFEPTRSTTTRKAGTPFSDGRADSLSLAGDGTAAQSATTAANRQVLRAKPPSGRASPSRTFKCATCICRLPPTPLQRPTGVFKRLAEPNDPRRFSPRS